jgi:hypothetical protein
MAIVNRFAIIMPQIGMRVCKIDDEIPTDDWFAHNTHKCSVWKKVSVGEILRVDFLNSGYDVTPKPMPLFNENGRVNPNWIEDMKLRPRITAKVVFLNSLEEVRRGEIYVLPLGWFTTQHFRSVSS